MNSVRGSKIFYVGIFIGFAGMIVGAVATIIEIPLGGSIMALIFFTVFGLAFGIPFYRLRKGKQLLKTGRRAQGKIVEVWDTNVTINNQPQIGLKIEVTPQTGRPFIAEVKMIISRLQTAYYQPGVPCTVRYNPEDTRTVAIESIGSFDGSVQEYNQLSASDSSPFFPGKSKNEIEKMLPEIDAENQRIKSIGVESKAIIKSVQWTNIYVNGNNTLDYFEIAVIPDNLPAFESTCFAFISSKSKHKYEAGKEIKVKYDPNDKRKITITGT